MTTPSSRPLSADDRQGVGEVGAIGRKAAGLFALQMPTHALGLLAGILIARFLTPAEKGVIDLVQVLAVLGSEVAMLGLPNGLYALVAKYERPLGLVHGTGAAAVTGLGLAVALLALLLLPWWRESVSAVPLWALLGLLAAMPAMMYKHVFVGLMLAVERVAESYRLHLLVAAVNLVGLLVLHLAGWLSLTSALAWWLAITVLHAGAGFVMLRAADARLGLSVADARRAGRFGLAIFAVNLMQLLHLRLDQLLISSWLGPGPEGIYAVSVRWAELLFLLDSALLMSALPAITRADGQRGQTLTTRVASLQFLISLAVALVLGLAAVWAVPALYGPAYGPAVTPLLLLLPGIVAWSAVKPVIGRLTYNMPFAGKVTAVLAGGTVLNVVLNWAFIQVAGWGIAGAALASSCSYLATAAALFGGSRRVTGHG